MEPLFHSPSLSLCSCTRKEFVQLDPRHWLQAGEHSKLYLRNEHRIVLYPDLQLHLYLVLAASPSLQELPDRLSSAIPGLPSGYPLNLSIEGLGRAYGDCGASLQPKFEGGFFHLSWQFLWPIFLLALIPNRIKALS